MGSSDLLPGLGPGEEVEGRDAWNMDEIWAMLPSFPSPAGPPTQVTNFCMVMASGFATILTCRATGLDVARNE